MVYVSYLKARSLSGKASRTQCRKPSFMRKFSKRIVLVHELRKLRAPKKFLNCGGNRPYIHKTLRCDFRNILSSHSLFYCSLHSGKTYSYLILQQFSYSSQSPVAKMIYIIYISYAIVEIEKITYRSNNISNEYMLRRKLILSHFYCFFH